jgi:multiple sugar transport system substrate-binding protein
MTTDIITFRIIIISVIIFVSGIHCTKKQPELTIWVGGAPQEVEYWEKLIEEFRQLNNYEVVLVIQPTDSDQRRQGLLISLESRQQDPDVFMMDVIWIGQFAKSRWLEPLDTYIEQSGFSTQPFFHKVVNLADRYDGRLYALPVNVDGGLLYYRKDLLEKYGFTSPPDTWDEMIQYSDSILSKESKINPNLTGFVWQGAQYEGLVCAFSEFASSNRGGFMRGDTINIDNEENIKALELMHDLIHKYKISPPNTYTEMKEEEVRQSFQRGNALFERNWPYAWKLHQGSDSPVKDKTGIALLPHFKNGESASALGGWHIGMSIHSDMKERAWEFIKFILSYNVQKKLVLNLGWNSAREDIYGDNDILQEMPHLEKLQAVFDHAVSRPNLPYYTQISEIMQRYINNCLAGKISPPEALHNSQKSINDIMKLYSND